MKIVVFTGAGISRESGIATFRDSDGLWASHRIEDVCTVEALARDRHRVIDFYNARRKEILSKKPNEAHLALVRLAQYFEDVEIITQNIDDLHERAGSGRVTHLHGEIIKLRSSLDELATVDLKGWRQEYDTRHADNSLLRPYVVFFGESVPMLDQAISIVNQASIMIVVGTSLQVYPAATLLNYLPQGASLYLVDPNTPTVHYSGPIKVFRSKATIGLPQLVDELIRERGRALF